MTAEIQQASFDKIARTYDALWSDTAVGKAQRSAVRGQIDGLFQNGDLVLDLGCGTGIDATHLQASGISVYAIDASVEMVKVAQRRGVDAHCRRIEDLDGLKIRVDGAISNFGALNCVPSLSPVSRALAEIVRPGGYLAICVLGQFCSWEIVYYLLQAKVGKAFRRLRSSAESSLGVKVLYPSRAEIIFAFQSHFRLLRHVGIGLFVPPSYVTGLTGWKVEKLAALDARLAQKPLLRSLADHCLYVFERI